MGHGRALPRARALRPPVRGAVRRHRDGRADGARRGRGALEGLRDDRPDHGRAGAWVARDQARGDGRAEGALPPAAGERRVARGLRADRAGLGLGLGGDAHGGTPRRRRVRHQRRQALHHERGRRGALRRVREDRSGVRPLGDLGVRRRGRHARASRSGGSSRRWASRARRPARSSSTTCASRPTTCSARRERASRSRCGSSTARGRGSRRRASASRRAPPTTRSSTRRRARRWASRSPSTS